MIRSLFILVALASPVFSQTGTSDQPLEMRSADWYLLCDNFNNCAVRGIASNAVPPAKLRSLVMIDRPANPDAPWRVRLVFMDDDGVDTLREALPDMLNLVGVDTDLQGAPLLLGLEGGAGDPIRYLPLSRVSDFFGVLADNDATRIRDQDQAFATMPQGDLHHLIKSAEQYQRVNSVDFGLEALESNGGLPRFSFDIYAADDERPALTPVLNQPCGSDDPDRSWTWVLAQGTRLWLVSCAQETKVFIQPRNSPLTQVQLDDINGNPYQSRDVDFDAATGLLAMVVPKELRADCGYQHFSGWDGDAGFIPILVTKMPFCRHIPYFYWPTFWEQDRWRVIGSTLDHGR